MAVDLSAAPGHDANSGSERMTATHPSDPNAFEALSELHGSGVAPYVQNALRLGHATPGTPRYERLLRKVQGDLAQTYHISDERKRELVDVLHAPPS